MSSLADDDGEGDVVHGQVVGLQDLGQVEVGEEEEEHEGGHEEPAVNELGAAVLVSQHQQPGHDGDHPEHDPSIGKCLPGKCPHIVRLLVEGGVDQVQLLLFLNNLKIKQAYPLNMVSNPPPDGGEVLQILPVAAPREEVPTKQV